MTTSKPKAELISVTKNYRGAYVITYLINGDYYRTRQFIDYSKREALKRANQIAKEEAKYDFQFTNQS